MTPDKKTNYDRELRAKISSATPAPPMLVGQAVPMARPVAPVRAPVSAAASSTSTSRPVAAAPKAAATVAATSEINLEFDPILPDMPSSTAPSYPMRTRRFGRRIDWRKQVSWAIIAAICVVALIAIFYVIGLVRSQNWQEWFERLDRLEAPPAAPGESLPSSETRAVEAPQPESAPSPEAGSP